MITIQKADWKTAVWDTEECRVKVSVPNDGYIELQLDRDSGFMFDEVKAGTIPTGDIEGIYSGLICRLLIFEGNPEYGENDYQGLTDNRVVKTRQYTITLHIPESRNYKAAAVSGTYSYS